MGNVEFLVVSSIINDDYQFSKMKTLSFFSKDGSLSTRGSRKFRIRSAWTRSFFYLARYRCFSKLFPQLQEKTRCVRNWDAKKPWERIPYSPQNKNSTKDVFGGTRGAFYQNRGAISGIAGAVKRTRVTSQSIQGSLLSLDQTELNSWNYQNNFRAPIYDFQSNTWNADWWRQ